MHTWKHAKKMVMILAISFIFSSTSSGAEGGTFQEVLTEYLEMGPSVRLNINAHGKSAEQIDKRLIDIYHKNGFQPFWIENGKPSRRAQDIIGVLKDAYLHGLFKQAKRAFSHGCIRMSRPAEMAAWVLGGEAKGWSVERVNEIVASKKRTVVNLEKPMPVYILYRTAYFNPEDKALHFYDDLYGRDALLAKALSNSGP